MSVNNKVIKVNQTCEQETIDVPEKSTLGLVKIDRYLFWSVWAYQTLVFILFKLFKNTSELQLINLLHFSLSKPRRNLFFFSDNFFIFNFFQVEINANLPVLRTRKKIKKRRLQTMTAIKDYHWSKENKGKNNTRSKTKMNWNFRVCSSEMTFFFFTEMQNACEKSSWKRCKTGRKWSETSNVLNHNFCFRF